MGRIGNWWNRRKVKSAVNTLKQFAGKDQAELAREGGWDLVAGNDWSWLQTQWQGANSIWKSYSTHDLENAYAIASTIFACIRIKATTAHQAWFEVGRYVKDGWDGMPDHPFYQLMRRPNGSQDTAGFIWEFVSHAETTGISYVWKVRNKGGGVIGIQPIPSSWLRKKYDDRSNKFLGYTLRGGANNAELFIPPSDMFVMRYPSAGDPTGSAGPLQAALRDLQVDDARADLLVEMLTNIHFPGAIFRQELGWSKPDKEEARAVLKDLIGPGKRASPLFISGANGSVELPTPPKDMDWPGTAMQSETRICATFGVPPIMIHLRAGLENGTYSNYESARRSFYQDTMRSLWEMMASAFERGLLIDEGDEELEMRPNFDDIPEMQEDASERHKRIRDDLAGGLLQWDEAISAIGGEPLPGNMGKVYFMPVSAQPIEITNEPGGTPVLDDEVNDDDDEDMDVEDDEHLDGADAEVVDEDEDENEDDARSGKSIIIASH